MNYTESDSVPVPTGANRKRKKKEKKDNSMNSSNYGSSGYWEQRYEDTEEYYDWYQDYSNLKDVLSNFIQPNFKILMVGCGNSKMGQDMVEAGFKEVINIDISSNVINAMREKTQGIEGLTFETMNVLDLKYDDHTFDAIIDKGTLDALLCGEGSIENGKAMVAEMARVLKKGGVFINITYGSPKFRLEYFENPKHEWTVNFQKIAKTYKDQESDFHYLYSMKKR